MYLLLKTHPNADMEGIGVTQCAVVEVDKETLDSWQGMMEHAGHISTKLGKDITLTWMDDAPKYYEYLPEDDEGMELNLDGGYGLVETSPFGERDPDLTEEESFERDPQHHRVPLSSSEIRVCAKALQWFSGPKYGCVEAYTTAITVEDIETFRQSLNAA